MNDAISSLTSTAAQSTSAVAANKLNSDYKTFLTLLTAQLTNQDPLEPMDSSTFVTQLAQLSQVEQAIQTNTNLESIRAQLSTAGLTNDLGLIGHEVSVPGNLFDLSGGQLRSATWAQVRAAEARVQAAVPEVLPLDDGLPERARAIAWRAQPHILDEALMALFERQAKEGEEDLDKVEAFKVYMLMWVATEALAENWKSPKGFEGDDTYTYVHIEPNDDDEAPADDGDADAAE